MPEWMDIETAPKDGTEILVCKRYKSWVGSNVYDHYIEIAYWTDYGWRIDAFAPPSDKDPTHWMPLPKPPEWLDK